MAKRCGKYGCGPRANWWRQTLGADYYSQGEAAAEMVSGATGIWSTYKLRSAYSGNAVRIKRASDSTTLDVAFVGNVLDKTAIDAFNSNGSVACTITIVYDQSGNANNLTVEAGRSEPKLYYDSHQANYVARFRALSPGGVFQIPVGFTINSRSASFYSIIRGRKTQTGMEAYIDLGTNNLLYYQNDFNSRSIYDGAADINPSKYIANSVDFNVHSVRCSASGVNFNIDNLFSTSSAVLTDITPAGGRIGRWTGGAGFDFEGDWGGLIAYGTSLSNTDDSTNISAIHSLLSKTVAHSKLVVCLGDSITFGVSIEKDVNYPIKLAREYAQTIKFINSGYAGNTLVQMNTDRAIRATDSIALGTYTNKVCIVWGGTNDILAGTTGANTHTNLQTLCQNLRTGGFSKIVVIDIIPRTDFNASQNTEKDAFNTLVAANYASYADAFVQASASTWTGLYVDGIHLTAAGCEQAKDLIKTALDTVI